MQKKAFQTWVQPLSNKLYQTALRMVVNREDARDIVQDAILKLWEKRHQLDDIENKEGWAMRMVINQSLDWLKKHKPIYMDLQDERVQWKGEDDTEKRIVLKEQLNTVHQLVQKLPPLQRTIFELREIQGLSYQEIADYLNLDLNLVKVNIHRIRKKLRAGCEAVEKYGIAKY